METFINPIWNEYSEISDLEKSLWWYLAITCLPINLIYHPLILAHRKEASRYLWHPVIISCWHLTLFLRQNFNFPSDWMIHLMINTSSLILVLCLRSSTESVRHRVVTGPIIPETIRPPLLYTVLVSEGTAIVRLVRGPVKHIRLSVSLLPPPDSWF